MPAFGRPHKKYRDLTDDEIIQLTETSIDDVLWYEYKERIRQEQFAKVARQFTGYIEDGPKKYDLLIDDPHSRPMPYGDKTAEEVIAEAMKRNA